MTRRLAWRDAKFGLQDYASEQLEDMELRGWSAVKERDLYRVFKPTLWQKVKPGDLLWVRERAMVNFVRKNAIDIVYEANNSFVSGVTFPKRLKFVPQVGKRLSMGCYREASRITLEVTATRIEPLQAVSEGDANAEGALWHNGGGVGHSGWRHDIKDGYVHSDCRTSFVRLWHNLHGADSWDANPGVVALTFKVHKQNIDAMKVAA